MYNSPRLFTLSAFGVGFILIDELDSTLQNALGNWFMLLGQTLCTNASSHFVKERKTQAGTSPTKDSDYTKVMLKKTVNAIEKYLEDN